MIIWAFTVVKQIEIHPSFCRIFLVKIRSLLADHSLIPFTMKLNYSMESTKKRQNKMMDKM